MIPLIGGDPAAKPATSTRFILPFAYAPESWGSNSPVSDLHYAMEEGDGADAWRWRHDYFTPETADVLYRHARWARLVGADALADFTIPHGGEPVAVRIARPKLVLFEWPPSDATSARGVDTSVLQTGFLIVEAFFPDCGRPPSLTALLRFNERFRYWRQPWDTHPDDPDRWAYRALLGGCPVDFLHPGSTIGAAASPDIYLTRWATLLDLPVRDAQGQVWRLFPRQWAARALRWISGVPDAEGDTLRRTGWVTYADTRTFVWTCAVAEGGGNALRRRSGRPDVAASELAPWVQLMNVDVPTEPQGPPTAFEAEWAKARTYGRWEAQGTFYGFNHHAAAMLGPPWYEPPLWKIFGSLYFDQTLLLIYLRVTTFRFSYELSRVSSLALRRNLAEFAEEFRRLRQLFAVFTNLYEFPLLSQQQQAIEMYALARRHLDVHELFEEIREEIQSSQEFVDLTDQRRQAEATTHLARTANRLAWVAVVGGGGALVTGVFGMNFFDADAVCEAPQWLRWDWPTVRDAIAFAVCGFQDGWWLRLLVSAGVIAPPLVLTWWLAGRLAGPATLRGGSADRWRRKRRRAKEEP